jgi:chromate reductase
MALAKLTPDIEFDFPDIGAVSYFNQDLEADPPADWTEFRESIAAADAVLFVTAEYNRSVPGVLKNALDVASRPHGKGALLGKTAAVISTSTGAIGGFGANHHLRQSLVFLNMPTMAQPEAYVGNSGKLFDDEGKLINDSTRDFLAAYGKAFKAFIEKSR